MRYQVKVKPGSSQEKIIETASGELTVFLRARPHDGEANASLLKLLSKYFGVSKTSISIIKGQKARDKVIEI